MNVSCHLQERFVIERHSCLSLFLERTLTISFSPKTNMKRNELPFKHNQNSQEIPTLNLLDPTLSKSEIIHRLYYVTIMAIAPISATRLSETRT